MNVITKTIISVNAVRDLQGGYEARILYAAPTDPEGANDTRGVPGFGDCA